MREQDDLNLNEAIIDEGDINLDRPHARLPMWPMFRRVSGTYTSTGAIMYRPPLLRQPIPIPIPDPDPGPLGPGPQIPMRGRGLETAGVTDIYPDETMMDTDVTTMDPTDEITMRAIPLHLRHLDRETIRIDVDGTYPQNVVSGTIVRGFWHRLHWIANLQKTGTNTWTGNIWYREGHDHLLPHTQVTVTAHRTFVPQQRRLRISFHGAGQPNRTRQYRFLSSYFHDVEIEYDREEGVTPVLAIDTHAHPNHPATVPAQNLSINTVYQKAGMKVTGGAASVVPSALSLGNGDSRWDDNEMHDAMQTYWSRFANTAQWAMWVFFANQHVNGSGLGGIMFDDIGPNHRQGTAIFYDSFISNEPAGDPDAAAYVARMRFWTACHEMGHAFNLAHSWQKDHSFGPSWIPLVNSYSSLSFMNYPFYYPGGENDFFANFENRFIDEELLFLRHAPSQFVQQGNADWFQNHGFENADTGQAPSFSLNLRLNRDANTVRFLEPVRVELKLENISNSSLTVDAGILRNLENLTIITMRQGGNARQVIPLAQRCYNPATVSIAPGEAIYATHTVSFGRGGWNITDPGRYVIQVALDLAGRHVVSNMMEIKVAPANNRDEEVLAQDVFTTDVARILTFGGSRVLTGGMDTLRQVADQLRDNPLALNANLVLGRIAMRNYKLLDLDETIHRTLQSATAVGSKTVDVVTADVEAARLHLETALTANINQAADTFCHVGLHEEIDRVSEWLADEGDTTAAIAMQDSLVKVLKKRITNKVVQTRVIEGITGMKEALKGGKTREAKN